MTQTNKIKDFLEIMGEIDHQITTNPKYRLQYIKELDKEIDKLNDELATEGFERKDVDPLDVAKKMGLKELVFDKNGKLIFIGGECKAKDFKW